VDADVQAAAGENRASNFGFRSLVRTHGVESDVDEHLLGMRRKLLGFLDFEDFATLVGAALGAGVVRTLALVAVGALREAGGGEAVVGAAKRGAPFGMAALWVGHCKFLSLPGGRRALIMAGLREYPVKL
jgi:hypothetical protein